MDFCGSGKGQPLATPHSPDGPGLKLRLNNKLPDESPSCWTLATPHHARYSPTDDPSRGCMHAVAGPGMCGEAPAEASETPCGHSSGKGWPLQMLLANRASCDGENALSAPFSTEPLAVGGYCSLEMWPVWLRSWILTVLILSDLNLGSHLWPVASQQTTQRDSRCQSPHPHSSPWDIPVWTLEPSGGDSTGASRELESCRVTGLASNSYSQIHNFS